MKVIVFGATGIVGSAVVSALSADHEVIGVSRSSVPSADVEDPDSIERLFRQVGKVDAVVSALGHVPFKPFGELTREDYIAGFFGKTLSQVDIVRIGTPYVRDGGSFTLTTGILAREPIACGSATALANGALEAYVHTVSRELPRGLRINVVSPSVLDEAVSAHASFPGFVPVSSSDVAMAFVKSVDGIDSGRVFPVE